MNHKTEGIEILAATAIVSGVPSQNPARIVFVRKAHDHGPEGFEFICWVEIFPTCADGESKNCQAPYFIDGTYSFDHDFIFGDFIKRMTRLIRLYPEAIHDPYPPVTLLRDMV
jgi:hypothetical protein